MLTSAAIIGILAFGYMALRDILARQQRREDRRHRFHRNVREHEAEVEPSDDDS
ncbi:MAG: hypothetical protein ACR2NZ_15315 [Rubripirellula sp.]